MDTRGMGARKIFGSKQGHVPRGTLHEILEKFMQILSQVFEKL
jgi:hypothetical protein